jgi:hypothetical protein
MIVMKKITQEWCVENINHKDWTVRLKCAKNIDIIYLPQMMYDTYINVRIVVAKRIDIFYLTEMMQDKAWNVRRQIAIRINKSFYECNLFKPMLGY